VVPWVTSINLACMEVPCLFINYTFRRGAVDSTPLQALTAKGDVEHLTHVILESRNLKKLKKNYGT
jgi:hypothetical protein